MKILTSIVLAMMIFNSCFCATISTTATDPFKSITSTSFTQPTFNFDFSSMNNRNQAQTAMNQARSSWDSFFTEKPKPVFT